MYNKNFLFISHSEKDSKIVEKFVDLLYDMGVPEKSMFCSSLSEIGVPIKEDIYEYLRSMLDSEQVIPVFMLSENYYASAACLNEMGAVWVKQKDYYTFLLPDFEFSKIKGAINPSKRGISLRYKSERELQNLKSDLNQFHEEMSKLFSLEQYGRWERKRDEFIAHLQNAKTDVTDIDLKECKGFCIGKYDHSGCEVKFDKIKNKICSKIDFTKTQAEICSVVIYANELDMSSQYETGKKLVFDLKASDTIESIVVECRLKNRDVQASDPVTTSSDWENYSIPLSKFNGSVSEWSSLKEIKFLLRRQDTVGGCVEIKNMMIK